MINTSRLSIASNAYGKQARSIDFKSNSIKSETTENEKPKNNTSLPDKVFENIQKMAREDAKKNVYMSDEFGAYRQSTMKQYVSPNRSKLIMMLNPMIANAQYTNGQPTFFSVLGFSVKYSVGAMLGAYLSIRDSSGQEILSYTPPPNGGWVSHYTKEESQWMDDTRAVYYEAYEAARAEIKAQETSSTPAGFHIKV